MARDGTEMTITKNLNDCKIRVGNTGSPDTGYVAMVDHTLHSGYVTAHFRDLKTHLIKYIGQYDYVVGCVAWLTDIDLVEAIASRRGASVIIQKEDFLRPDSGRYFKKRLRSAYAKIDDAAITNLGFPYPLNECNPVEHSTGIRCVGNHNRDKRPACPRMHNKFLVFANECYGQAVGGWVSAQAVWTGSFNFSHNGGNSLENAVFIDDHRIAAAYLREFAQIASISEPLDWTTDWVASDVRIGS